MGALACGGHCLALIAIVLTMPVLCVEKCKDRDVQCDYWSAIGECDVNPKFMHVMCKAACRLCLDGPDRRAPEFYRALEGRYAQSRSGVLPSKGPQMVEVSYSPRVYAIDNFLSDSEIDALKASALPRLSLAKTVNGTTGVAETDKVRSNSQMYFTAEECVNHSVISKVVRRMHTVARMPMGHGEVLQIGRYQLGQFYEPHFDSVPHQDVVRAATILVYLEGSSDGGGETIFPKREKCTEHEKFVQCCENLNRTVAQKGGGFWSVPRKGTALLFYNHDLDGRHNAFSIHGACPVKSGEKWVAQQWFRQEAFSGSPHIAEAPK